MMHHYTEAQVLMFGDDYKKYKKEIVNTTNEFYVMVVNRLQSEYLFFMTAAWTMIIVINLSLILLVMVIKHKEVLDKKPVRKVIKKIPVKKPRVLPFSTSEIKCQFLKVRQEKP
jgi:hypothetical protein